MRSGANRSAVVIAAPLPASVAFPLPLAALLLFLTGLSEVDARPSTHPVVYSPVPTSRAAGRRPDGEADALGEGAGDKFDPSAAPDMVAPAAATLLMSKGEGG